MDPLPSKTLDTAALMTALTDEATFPRIWLPPERWWGALIEDNAAIAAWIHRKLVRGAQWSRSHIVDVRKPGHGIRPVSLMSPEVRVVYRALAASAVPVSDRPDRSASSYADFVVKPIVEAFAGQTGLQRLGDSRFSHILIADIAAFYQYVDHAILQNELDLASASADVVDGLVGLLADIEGRSFGIPQRSAPSDWLSECYAARVERLLTRAGFDVWRYSDDFRVGCSSYAEALRAIEALSRAARDVGLVLNDQKTATPTFSTYMNLHSNIEVRDDSAAIDPSDVEAAVSTDYAPEDDDQALEEARELFGHFHEPERTSRTLQEWDITSLTPEQHRQVRRALNTVTRHKHPVAIPHLLSILVYQPAMTHRIVGYAEALAHTHKQDLEQFFEDVVQRVSLSEWQRAWIAYGIGACDLPKAQLTNRVSWLERQLASRGESLATAEAAITLAKDQAIDFRSLHDRLRSTSEDLAPSYLHAMSLLDQSGGLQRKQLNALKSRSAVSNAILSSTA